MACDVVESRLGYIETGLRSFDRSILEEINRLVIDELAELFFVTKTSELKNLKIEQKYKENSHHVDNTMIDSLVQFEPVFKNSEILNDLNITPKEYFVFTFHRPGNVDNIQKLTEMVGVIKKIALKDKEVFIQNFVQNFVQNKYFNFKKLSFMLVSNFIASQLFHQKSDFISTLYFSLSE